jgi:c-di-GMP phosphodiesterase
MSSLLLARQPIFNTTLDVVGYELLHHAYAPKRPAGNGAEGPAAQNTLERINEIGLANLVGDRKAFINTSRNYLLGRSPIPLPPGGVVLEVLDEITGEADMPETLAALAQQGFQIALEKVVSVNKVSKLLALVHIVKIDLTTLDRVSLAETVKRLRLHRVKLLATNVETLDDLAFCQHLGFDYVQGYFLCKPRIVRGRRLDASRAVVMRSLAEIQDETADFQSLAKVIAQDVSLSYKLLKLVNSTYYSLSKTITSLEQAVALIGLNQLRAWMTLLLMASVRNKPHELTTLALTRAKTCELVAKANGERQTDTYFLVGLFSILDALMDLPMAEAIGSLPLSEEISQALVSQKGNLGEVLRFIQIYERGQWDDVLKMKPSFKPEGFSAAYLEAVRWTIEALRAMNA